MCVVKRRVYLASSPTWCRLDSCSSPASSILCPTSSLRLCACAIPAAEAGYSEHRYQGGVECTVLHSGVHKRAPEDHLLGLGIRKLIMSP